MIVFVILIMDIINNIMNKNKIINSSAFIVGCIAGICIADGNDDTISITNFIGLGLLIIALTAVIINNKED